MIKVFGWAVAIFGVLGLCSSVGLEIVLNEPIYLLLSKMSAGVMGIGGIILAISTLGGKKHE